MLKKLNLNQLSKVIQGSIRAQRANRHIGRTDGGGTKLSIEVASRLEMLLGLFRNRFLYRKCHLHTIRTAFVRLDTSVKAFLFSYSSGDN